MIPLLLLCGVAWAKPSDDEPDDEVVVTSSGREESMREAVHRTVVLDADTLRRTGATSVADALEVAANVQVTQGPGGTGVQLQGMDPKHTVIVVDGVRLGGRVGGIVDLTRIPVADVESIEIVQGPAATLYGSDAVAGVIHIRTTRGSRDVRLRTSIVAGRFASTSQNVDPSVRHATATPALHTVDASAAVSGGAGPISTRTSLTWSSGEATDITPKDAGTTINAFRQLRVQSNADVVVHDAHRWHTDVSWQSYRRWGLDTPDTGAVIDRTNLTAEWSATAGPELQLSEATRLRATAGVRGWTDQYRADQRKSSQQDTYQRTQDLLAQTNVRLDHDTPHHAIALNAEVLHEALTADRIDPGAVSRTRVALVGLDQWDPLDTHAIALQAGLRMDYDSSFGMAVSPRLGTRWSPRANMQVRMSVGQGYRAPDFREMYLTFENASVGYRVDGNQDLRPERSSNVQAGVQWQPSTSLDLGVHGFHNEVQDLIQTDLVHPGGVGQPQQFMYVNVSSSRTSGAEVEARLRWAERSSISANYRVQHTLDRHTGLPLSGRSPHRVSLSTQIALPVWDLTAHATGALTGPRQFVDIEDLSVTTSPSTTNVDLGLSMAPHARWVVHGGVQNALDAGSKPDHLLQSRPRRVFLGLTTRLGPKALPPGAMP